MSRRRYPGYIDFKLRITPPFHANFVQLKLSPGGHKYPSKRLNISESDIFSPANSREDGTAALSPGPLVVEDGDVSSSLPVNEIR